MLSRDLARHVEQRRSLGYKCHSEHVLLRGFVAFAERRGDTHVKSARVLAWAAEAPSAEQRRNRLLTVRRFALAIQAEDRRHQIPAADAFGQFRVRRPAPYIYKPHDVVRLLRAASKLEPAGSIRPIMYTTLFGLIAATGMRIAEALALQVHDVGSDGLVVRDSKYHESRLLVVHKTTQQALDRYMIARRQIAVADRALFISVAGKSLPYETVRNVFLGLLDRIDLRGAHAGRDPRIHDLRHNSEHPIIPSGFAATA
jgi:integrase